MKVEIGALSIANKIFIAVITFLLIFVAVTGTYVRGILDSRNKKISENTAYIVELESQKQGLQISLADEIRKVKALEGEKQGAINIGASLMLQTEVLREIGKNIATEFDSLDELILSDDQRNVEIVDWFVTNGTFFASDGSLTAATLRYDDWKRRQVVSTKEYRRIKASVNESVEKFGKQMEALAELDLGSAPDIRSQVY